MSAPDRSNRRIFLRQRASLDSDVVVSGRRFRAKVGDFSLSGVGVLIRDAVAPGPSSVYLTIRDLDVDTRGRVIWSRSAPEGMWAGIDLAGPLRGNLTHHRLSDLFLGIQKTRRTGVLRLTVELPINEIFFREGALVLPPSLQGYRDIGEILLGSGRITSDQYRRALDASKKTGRHPGAVLVGLGNLSAAELSAAVRKQAEEIALALFGVDRGSFVFTEAPVPENKGITFMLRMENLIYRGLKAGKRPEGTMRNRLPADAVLCFPPDSAAVLAGTALDEDGKEVCSLINGRRTVREILSLSSFHEAETLRTLSALYAIQAVENSGRQESEVPRSREEGKGQPEEEIPQVLLERMERIYREHRSLGYHRILDVDEGASAEEIKRAYHKMAKEFHPDRYLRFASDSLREKVHVVFSCINEAYRELYGTRKPPRSEAPVSKEKSQSETNRDLAKSRAKEGLLLFSAGRYEEAATFFGQAVYLDGTEPEYHHYLGMAFLNCKKMKPAEGSFKKALELDPTNAKYGAELGHLYLKLGFGARARTAFERALKCDPSDKRAAEGLRRLKG
ncbi:MAG: DnaJ domain-containing protein [Nitrospirae bacterium]|nr:DnaJ domain-containing protein [Nitrospirota bacterium]